MTTENDNFIFNKIYSNFSFFFLLIGHIFIYVAFVFVSVFVFVFAFCFSSNFSFLFLVLSVDIKVSPDHLKLWILFVI